ncbi:MAG TPA: response regulator transcription factor [Candidatus Acidoferrales bacterium]|jgi:DNA-binding NarL/FixJ family response regulator
MESGHTGVVKLATPAASMSFLGETNNTNHPVLFQNPMNGDDSSPAARKRFRILIADDHEAVRRGLRSAVSSAGWDLCGEAVHGKDAVEKVQALNPDLVILDLSMPVMNGLDAAREIRKTAPNVKIVGFTMHESLQVKEQTTMIGFHALAAKSAPLGNLLATVKSVLEAS